VEENKKYYRVIRSFVRREGRLTPAQQRALDDLYPIYGLKHEGVRFDFEKIFNRQAKTILEIGFGMGDSLAEMAKNQPEHNFIGIEVHRPGVGALLQKVQQQALNNIRVMEEDAVEILRDDMPDHALDVIQIFFPDPWHKKRHHKRRLIKPEFVQLMMKKLKPGGMIHLATDWEHYAEQMMEVLSNTDGLKNMSGDHLFAPRPAWRPLTKFEKRGENLGHGVWDLLFVFCS